MLQYYNFISSIY